MGLMERFKKKSELPRDYFACLRCNKYSTTNEERLLKHAEKCGETPDGKAVFLDGATDDEVEDAPKRERRKFLGLL
jgi:hypothetical protein